MAALGCSRQQQTADIVQNDMTVQERVFRTLDYKNSTPGKRNSLSGEEAHSSKGKLGCYYTVNRCKTSTVLERSISKAAPNADDYGMPLPIRLQCMDGKCPIFPSGVLESFAKSDG